MSGSSARQPQSTSSWYGAPLFAEYPEIQDYLESVEEFVATEVGTHPMLSEQIAARLRELIQGGKLTFGDRLMEIDLARRFLASRGPVREALRMLDEEGLIELRPRRGAIVHQLSVRELNEIYDLRLCISCLTARLAAVGPVPVKKWGQLYDAGLSLMSRVASAQDIPPIVWISLRRALDRLMFGLVGNAVAGRLSQQFENRLATHYVNAAPTKRDLVLRDRRNLKAAILKRDPERAATAMRQLIGRARRNVLSELGNPADD
jgi:DNA-binding GntR family transcriptional regulator